MGALAARLAALALAAASLAFAGAKRPAPLRVVEASGDVRLCRFETEAWPLDLGAPLPDDSRLELKAGSTLRLRYGGCLDFVLAGPARFAVYAVPSPDGPQAEPRLVLKLDQGALLVDGRFQFGRPADLVLSLPDRDLALKPDRSFYALVRAGASAFYVPAVSAPGASPAASAVAATLSAGAVTALAQPRPATGPKAAGALPAALLAQWTEPVPVFVVARDFNQDLGLWPRPAVLGPLLAERLAQVPGVRVVDGSGDTHFARLANSALKKGQDDFLKAMALAQGARWALVGNCVTDSPLREGGGPGRWVRGQTEVRLLDAESPAGSLELVSEAAVTRVARAGRPLEQASREAFEAASDEVARYVCWQVEDLLRGKPHAETLLRLEVDNAGLDALQALRARLGAMDSVQRFFRRQYYGKVADYDLMLRRESADFDAQWAAASGPSGGWTFLTLTASASGERRVRAVKAP